MKPMTSKFTLSCVTQERQHGEGDSRYTLCNPTLNKFGYAWEEIKKATKPKTTLQATAGKARRGGVSPELIFNPKHVRGP